MNTQTTVPSSDAESRSTEYIISLIDIIDFLKQSVWAMAMVTVVTIAIALLYIATATPLYTASTVLIVYGQSRGPVLLNNLNGTDTITDRHLQGQIEIMKSPGIARKVVNMVGIDKISTALANNRNLSKAERINHAAFMALEGVRIKIVNLSNVVELTVSASEPQRAALLANGFAKAYIKDAADERKRKADTAAKWLNERIASIQEKLRAVDFEIQRRRARREDAWLPTGKDRKVGKVLGVRTPISELTQSELSSKHETFKRIYQSYLRAYSDSIYKMLYPKSSARIVSLATPPSHKSSPKVKFILVLALVIGVASGLLFKLLSLAIENEKAKRDQKNNAKENNRKKEDA